MKKWGKEKDTKVKHTSDSFRVSFSRFFVFPLCFLKMQVQQSNTRCVLVHDPPRRRSRSFNLSVRSSHHRELANKTNGNLRTNHAR